MSVRFNMVLEDVGLDPLDVSIILHTTNIQKLRKLLPVMVAENRELFEVYQSVHSPRAERALVNRDYVASFVPAYNGNMVFVGLYQIVSAHDRAVEDIYGDHRFADLENNFGATDTGPAINIARGGTQKHFNLRRMDRLSDLCGRHQIAPPAGRTYVRIASNLNADIKAISQESILIPPPPAWNDFIVDSATIRTLPISWRTKLEGWRGIYLIVDETDGKRYVGSAYGLENIYGRWSEHVAHDRGITIELRLRNPVNFRFSILELVAPTMGVDEIVMIENNWKNRLHTIEHGLNVT